MDIAILLYDGVTALDAIGPYEVLARLLKEEFILSPKTLRRNVMTLAT